MIIFYQKSTGKVFGTMNGFNPGKTLIKPSNIDESDIDHMILDVNFENKNKDIISDILLYKVHQGKLVK